MLQKKDDFKYLLDKIEYLENDYFTLADKGETIQQMTIEENDFPLTIRNYKNQDKIKLRFGHKKSIDFLLIERFCTKTGLNGQL